MVRPLDGELVDGQPFIVAGIGPVDQPDKIAARVAVLIVLNGNASHQQLMKIAVSRQLRGNAQAYHLLQRILPCREGNGGVQAINGIAQSLGQ